MANADIQLFRKEKVLYVVDCWGTSCGSAPFATSMEILDVDYDSRQFIAVLYGDTYQKYSFSDYGRLIFSTMQEAENAQRNMPGPGSLVSVKKGNAMLQERVECVNSVRVNGVMDLQIKLSSSGKVSSKLLGNEIFKD